jgi:hypothetical protein
MLLATGAAADVLELRDGRVLEGRLAASTGGLIRFETAGGVVAVPVEDASVLRFGAAQSPAPGEASPASGAHAPRALVQIPAGTRLRVRVKDTLDPRRVTAGDRFAARIETPIGAGERVVVPQHAVVYGVVSAASPTGPVTQQLRLELTDLQLSGRRIAIVTGPHARVAEAPAADAPANAATDPVPPRVPAGTLLEFRLLQPLEL